MSAARRQATAADVVEVLREEPARRYPNRSEHMTAREIERAVADRGLGVEGVGALLQQLVTAGAVWREAGPWRAATDPGDLYSLGDDLICEAVLSLLDKGICPEAREPHDLAEIAHRPLDDEQCEDCSARVVCMICNTCAEHCRTDGDPDACWKAHESWRLGPMSM